MPKTWGVITYKKPEGADAVEFEAASYSGAKGEFHIFPSLCKGCGLCMVKCPKKCIDWSHELGAYGTPRVEPRMEECIACGMCQLVCPDCAIKIERK